jgi:RND family efflux transporter MFP subunit
MSIRLLLASVFCGLLLAGGPAAGEGPPVVEVSQPVQREVTDYAEFTGRLEAAKRVDVRPRVSGYLAKIRFDIGDKVREGDVLFEIDPRPFQAELDKASANVEACKARLERAEADHKRMLELMKRGVISKEDFDRSVADKAVASAELIAATAAREAAKLDLAATRPTAPFAGVVIRRLADPGSLLKAAQTYVLTIIALDPIRVAFDIDEKTALRLARDTAAGGPRAKERTRLPVSIGLADEKGYPHRGQVDVISGVMDPSTGTLRVRAVLPNPDEFLKPGMFARVRLPLGEPRKVLLVQGSAFIRKTRDAVLVVNDKKVVELRQVEVGLAHDDGGWQEIKKGLRADEWVVRDSSARVREGMKVEPKKVPATEDGEKKP